MKYVLYAVVLCSIIALILYLRNNHTDYFFDMSDMPSVVSNMNESDDRQRLFAASLLLFDPRTRKYQDPRTFDFHVCGESTLAWKNAFRDHIGAASKIVLEYILQYPKTIILFDRENLVGNVIFVPIDNQEQNNEIRDPVVYRKYIKWNPPANMISAIIPVGYKLRVVFDNNTFQDILEGITRNFVIANAITSLITIKT